MKLVVIFKGHRSCPLHCFDYESFELVSVLIANTPTNFSEFNLE